MEELPYGEAEFYLSIFLVGVIDVSFAIVFRNDLGIVYGFIGMMMMIVLSYGSFVVLFWEGIRHPERMRKELG